MDEVLVLMCILFCMKCVESSSCPATCACTSAETSCRNASLQNVPDDLSEGTIKLVLSNNVFPALDSNRLRLLTRLKFVDLSNNGIKIIENGFFCTSEELEILNLNNNEITIKNPDTFSCLKKMRRLNLKNNQISSIPPGLFRNNTNLVVLDLSYNLIAFLEAGTFQQNLLLSYVIIAGNPISSVYNFTTPLSRSLNVLDIQFCGHPSIISYQRYLTLYSEQNMAQVKDLLADDLTSSDRHLILDAMKPKLDALSYNQLDYLYLNTTMRTATTYSGAPVFCYCNLLSLWYWCIDEASKCADMKDAFHNRECDVAKKVATRTSVMKQTASGQVEAKPILPILVLILVVLILVTV